MCFFKDKSFSNAWITRNFKEFHENFLPKEYTKKSRILIADNFSGPYVMLDIIKDFTDKEKVKQKLKNREFEKIDEKKYNVR